MSSWQYTSLLQNCVSHDPKIGKKISGATIIIGLNTSQPMAVVERLLFSNGVGVIEPNQPFAIRGMQGQGIVEPMRLCRSRRHPTNDEFYPMAASRIDDHDL